MYLRIRVETVAAVDRAIEVGARRGKIAVGDSANAGYRFAIGESPERSTGGRSTCSRLGGFGVVL